MYLGRGLNFFLSKGGVVIFFQSFQPKFPNPTLPSNNHSASDFTNKYQTLCTFKDINRERFKRFMVYLTKQAYISCQHNGIIFMYFRV